MLVALVRKTATTTEGSVFSPAVMQCCLCQGKQWLFWGGKDPMRLDMFLISPEPQDFNLIRGDFSLRPL